MKVSNYIIESLKSGTIIFLYIMLSPIQITAQEFYPIKHGNIYIVNDYYYKYDHYTIGGFTSVEERHTIDTVEINDSILVGSDIYYKYYGHYYMPVMSENRLYMSAPNYFTKKLSMDFNILTGNQVSIYDFEEKNYKHNGIVNQLIGDSTYKCFNVTYLGTDYGGKSDIKILFAKNIGELVYDSDYDYGSNSIFQHIKVKRMLYYAKIDGKEYNLLRTPSIDSIISTTNGYSTMHLNYQGMTKGVTIIIEKKGPNESSFSEVGQVLENKVFFLVGENLNPQNVFRVKAKFNNLYSIYSEEVIPKITGLVQDETFNNGVLIKWNTINSIQCKVVVERKPTGTISTLPFSAIDTVAGNLDCYYDTTSREYGKYDYRLKLLNGNGSSYSKSITALPKFILKPLRYFRCSLTEDDNIRIELKNEDNLVMNNRVDYRKMTEGTDFRLMANMSNSDSIYVFEVLSDNCFYQFRVYRSFNAVTYSISDTIEIYMPIFKEIKSVTNLSPILLPNGKVKLTWSDNANNELDYVIYRGIDTNHYSTLWILPMNTESFIDENPNLYGLNGCKYYGVKGRNSKTESKIVFTKLMITNLDEDETISEYLMEQNYPNPFNPVTSISYTLKERRMVKMVIYDVLGKVVTELVNEEKEAGKYRIEFDGSNLPSGIYYYRIMAGDFSETKKMILLK